MEWIIVLAIIVGIIIVANSAANSPQKQLSNLKQWFDDYPETYYVKVQGYFRAQFQERFDKEKLLFFEDESDFIERRNEDRVVFRENELWHRHILTILAMDKYTVEAKRQVAQAWFEYIYSHHKLIQGLEMGFMDTDTLVQWGGDVNEARNRLIGVMEAFNYKLEAESKQITSEVAEQFPVKRNRRHPVSR